MEHFTIAGTGSNLPLTLAVLIVGVSFLYWAFTSAGNDKLIGKAHYGHGFADGYLACLKDHCEVVPSQDPLPFTEVVA